MNHRNRPGPGARAIAWNLALCCFVPAVQAADAFISLGSLGGTHSYAFAVSADGGAVAGWSNTPYNAATHAFRWVGGSMADLGTLGGTSSYAYGISASGDAVVGVSQTSGDAESHAVRWLDGVMSDLGTLGGTYSSAAGVSADGGVVVGQSYIAGDTIFRAFRWTGGTLSDLGTLGGNHSTANAVSADGGVVVGFSHTLPDDSVAHAFRWQGGVMADLGTLGGSNSIAQDVSADGAVVVGFGHIQGDGAFHAFRWQGGAMSDLSTLGGLDSLALGVSADGSVVVGNSQLAGETAFQAFRWTRSGGMQSVAAWLTAAGVSVPSGWELLSATDVNANGNVLVGLASYTEGPFVFYPSEKAWLARVGPEGSGLMSDIPAYNASVAQAGSLAVRAGVALPNLALFGAHHRSLLDSGLVRKSGNACAWATADAAGGEGNAARMEVVEAGVCGDIGPARVGLGLGRDRARQDWNLGGDARLEGEHLVVEGVRAFDRGVEASVLAYYGRFDTEMRRHYMNGASVDASSGEPDARSLALRLRLDWKDALSLGRVGLSPYAAYTRSKTWLDAYRETGGSFPAQFSSSSWTIDDLRLGAASRVPLATDTDLRLGLELAHRFEGRTQGVNGSVVGLWDFSLAGQQEKQNWARLTADLDHRLSATLALTFGATAATSGGDASWGVNAGLRSNF